jgi:hypothetical protein
MRWQTTTHRLTDELMHRSAVPSGRVSSPVLGTLPAPVQRYFRRVLPDGRPAIKSVRAVQAGRFRSRESLDPEAGWRPFEATQLFTAEPPGFVWDARIWMVPLLPVRVRDGYVDGRATMLGAILGLVPVVKAADDVQLRTGALQRYLAESVWFPTALLPSHRLRWSPIDDSHARATLTDGDTAAALDFEFGPSGEIVGCFTSARSRAVPGNPGRFDSLPWGGRYRRYDEHDGVRIPFESEVYWVVSGREQPYYRGGNVLIDYDFAPELAEGAEIRRRS